MISFFFNDTATTEIYTLSLHDALPIFAAQRLREGLGLHDARDGQRVHRDRVRVVLDLVRVAVRVFVALGGRRVEREDRKSTRLNSSHANISYAVFCLKKKNKM